MAAAFYSMPDGTVEIRGGANGDKSYKYSGYTFRWVIQTGANAGGGNMYGGRISTPVIIEKDKTVVATYKDFIGEWTMEGVKTPVTIAAKEEGSTYTITGLTGYDGNNYPAVEAYFENGFIYLKEQELKDYTHATYGACKRILQGVFASGSSTYGFFWFNSKNYNDEPQVIFTGKKQEDGTVKLLSGSCPYGTFVGFRYAWVIVNESHSAYRNGNAASTMALPSSLTPPAPAETDDTAIVSAAYNDFIGSWTDGENVWTISAKENGSTYAIDGLPGQDYYSPIEAVYDNGSFYVMEQGLGQWNSTNYGLCQDALSGIFVYNNVEYAYYPYFCPPFGEGTPQKIFTANKRASGNITFTAGSCQYGTFVGVALSWVILNSEDENYGKGAQEDTQYLDVIMKPVSAGASAAPASVHANGHRNNVISKNTIDDTPKSNKAADLATWTLSKNEKANVESVAAPKEK